MDEERILSQRLLHYSTLPKIEQFCSEVLVNEQLEKISNMCRLIVQDEMSKGSINPKKQSHFNLFLT